MASGAHNGRRVTAARPLWARSVTRSPHPKSLSGNNFPVNFEESANRGLLAPYIGIQAVRDLATHHPAGASALGIAVTASSVVIMPALGITKQRLSRRLNSGATAGEGIQNLMCAGQAAAVLLGLAVVAVWPAGWPVDPVIALGIAAWSAWEGRQAWRGDSCC